MFITTKFATTWFADNERTLANTIALSSNMLGSLVGGFISPQIISFFDNSTAMNSLNLVFCSISLVPAIMSCFVTRSSPKIPPSYSAFIEHPGNYQKTLKLELNKLNLFKKKQRN
jgi:MFS transporter, FLVCR family, MFS-domain-containing protein 7